MRHYAQFSGSDLTCRDPIQSENQRSKCRRLSGSSHVVVRDTSHVPSLSFVTETEPSSSLRYEDLQRVFDESGIAFL